MASWVLIDLIWPWTVLDLVHTVFMSDVCCWELYDDERQDCHCVDVQIPCDVLISVKTAQSSQPTAKPAGKQAAITAAADSQVFDVSPARCTIQPGSYTFTTVTFSPVALQVHLLSLALYRTLLLAATKHLDRANICRAIAQTYLPPDVNLQCSAADCHWLPLVVSHCAYQGGMARLSWFVTHASINPAWHRASSLSVPDNAATVPYCNWLDQLLFIFVSAHCTLCDF